MAPGNVLAVCVFLAVTSASLLIFLLVSRIAGRTRKLDDELGDPLADPIPGSGHPKPAAYDVMFDVPRVKSEKKRASRLRLPVVIVILVLLSGGLMLVAREVVRSRFEEVIRRISSERPFDFDSAGKHSRPPEFKMPTFPLESPRPVQFPLDSKRTIGRPSGSGFNGAPGNRSSVRFRWSGWRGVR
jgi:hypothetical protein